MQQDIFLKNCKKLVENLFEILEVELEELTEQEKELLIAYSFGMISIMSEESQISKEMEYYSIEKVIIETFKYSKQQAKDMLQELIDSIQKGGKEIFEIMIHQGKFVYPKYKENNYNEVYDRLTNMIDVIVSGEYKNY